MNDELKSRMNEMDDNLDWLIAQMDVLRQSRTPNLQEGTLATIAGDCLNRLSQVYCLVHELYEELEEKEERPL